MNSLKRYKWAAAGVFIAALSVISIMVMPNSTMNQPEATLCRLMPHPFKRPI
ncbi:hypothetical protein MOB87_10275 [Bacillus sonorensis]|uniref:hypothetical protein n=1 Tax=Bacillus sonorensis TaxID=119858 RepID=UPI002280F653|nr:hypothetical protein [Bacillus sonorensis]MCY8088042.1 hypothetical protein [Bacillus sonorensis]